MAGKTTDKVRFFVPSVAEYNNERAMAVQCRQVVVGPATLEDLANVDLFDYIQKTKRFTIKYQQAGEGEYKGYLELTFDTPEEATTCAESLSKLKIRDDLKVMHAYPVNNRPVDTRNLRQHGDPEAKAREGVNGSGHEYQDADRTLVIIDIANDVTEKDLVKAFPTASSCFIPVSFANKSHKKKGYAYVDFKNDKDLVRYLGKEQNIKGKGYKTTKTTKMPIFTSLLKQIEHFRENDLPYDPHGLQEPMPEETVAVLKALINHTYHYGDVDYLPAGDKRKAEEARKSLAPFLYADNDLRRDMGMPMVSNNLVRKTYEKLATGQIPGQKGGRPGIPHERMERKRPSPFDGFEAKRARMGVDARMGAEVRAREDDRHQRIAEDRRMAAAAAYGRERETMGGGMRGAGMGNGMMESVTRMATHHVMEALNSRMGGMSAGGSERAYMEDGFQYGHPAPRVAAPRGGARGGARGAPRGAPRGSPRGAPRGGRGARGRGGFY